VSITNPNRLFPLDERTRELARELHAIVEHLPIISPHGHVDPQMLRDNHPFPNPSELLIRHDHYVTRLLHATGSDLGLLLNESNPRAVWAELVNKWNVFAGTASGYWLQQEFEALFGIQDIAAMSPDSSYNLISAALGRPEMRPQALLDRFGIEVLATTDDPLSDLAPHSALSSGTGTRILPTFRADAYIDPSNPNFLSSVRALADHSGDPLDDYSGYLAALEERRDYFKRHGAVSADHGVRSPRTLALDPDTAAALYSRAVRDDLDEREKDVFGAHMLLQMAGMSSRDGLVMTVHAGVYRNHHSDTWRTHGPDTGHDIPVPTSFTENLRPLLEAYGLTPGFHLILFTVDETTLSREIAPLAGFYPSVFIGAPWWFLDAPDSAARFRASTVETAGFYRGSGFIDDTRAFLSIPARHDMARRGDAAFLARLVGEGRLSKKAAEQIVVDVVDRLPRVAFKL